MTYPPEDYYEKDMKKTKSVLRTIFSKAFIIALIVTIVVYFLIDKFIQWLS